MESCDYYSDEDEEFNQRETVSESCNEKNLLETKYEKWLDSNTHISNISSIYRLELAEQERLEQEEVKAKEKKYLGCLGVVVAIILYIFILSKCG